MGKHTQNKWKKAGNGISSAALSSSTQQHSAALSNTQQHSAALSSTQQHSAVLNLQPIPRFSWLFASSGWKKKNNRKNNAKSIKKLGKNIGNAIEMLCFWPKPIKNHGKNQENFSKTNGKRLGIAFLSNAQSATYFGVFPDFLQGQGRKRWERSQKIAQKSIKNWGKNNDIWTKQWENTHKTNGKRVGMGFLNSTQQHSATLSSTQQCSICNQFQGFPDFLQAQGEKRKIIEKITQNPSKKLGKNIGNAIEMLCFWPKPIKNHGKNQENFSKTNGKRLGIAFLSNAQSATYFGVFPDFLQGQGRKRWERSQKIAQKSIKNWGKNNDIWTKQWENTQNKWKKAGNGISQQHSAALSSTQQHSAALSSAQSATNFKVFLTFCRPRVKIEKESQK